MKEHGAPIVATPHADDASGVGAAGDAGSPVLAIRTRFSIAYATEARLVILLTGLIVLFLLIIGNRFVDSANLFSIALQLPELGILALAMMVSLLHGGVNLSIISTANMSALTMAYFLTVELPGASGFMWGAWIAIAIGAGVGVSVLIGLINGLIIAYIGVSPILTTLGTMIMVKGLAIGLTRGIVISGFPSPILFIGQGTVLGIPFGMTLFGACILIVAVVLGWTPFGASIYLMGSNERATQYSGVNTRSVIVGIYVMSSVLAAVAGFIMLSRFNSANASYGESYLLVTVLASILGGTDPFGGFGKVSGLVLSVLILQVVASAFNQLGLSQYLTLSIWGLILIGVSTAAYLRNPGSTR
jgi:ribose/xylose/arabinose/galactoside ABC-type transport system permease subunit